MVTGGEFTVRTSHLVHVKGTIVNIKLFARHCFAVFFSTSTSPKMMKKNYTQDFLMTPKF